MLISINKVLGPREGKLTFWGFKSEGWEIHNQKNRLTHSCPVTLFQTHSFCGLGLSSRESNFYPSLALRDNPSTTRMPVHVIPISVRVWQQLFNFLVLGTEFDPNVYLPSFSLRHWTNLTLPACALAPTTSMSQKCCACHWSKVCKSSLQISQCNLLKKRLPFPLAQGCH